MSLPLNKREILETMLINDKPAKATDIAKETGRDFKPVMMHILGLIRMGYAYTPEKGLYVITEKGKQALGLPETNKEAAKTIIAQIPSNKAFHFYSDIGKPLNLYANSLQDFSSKIPKAGEVSIEFHLKRGDFEAWFAEIGDLELAKKASLLKERKVTGPDLSPRLQNLVEKRLRALAVIAC
jgi:hypothetical protein